MNISIMKLCLVFAVTTAILWMKRPLFWAISGGLAAAFILHGVRVSGALSIMGRALVGRDAVMMVLSFYFITFLQHMLERKDHLKQTEQSLNWLFNNHWVNASAVPAVISLLPSAGTITICTEVVRSSCQDYLSNEDVIYITSFCHHIPESFLLIYSSIPIALAVSDAGTGEFVLAMLSLVAILFIIGHIFYLRGVPRSTGQKPEGGRKRVMVMLFKSLWSILLIMMLLITFDIPACMATPMVAILNIFVNHLRPREITPIFKTAFKSVIISNAILIMMFRDIITYTRVIHELPVFFGGLSIPPPMVSALISFFGTIISGPNAIMPLYIPMTITAMPETSVPLLVLLMGPAYATMQVSPIHVCLFIAAECLKVDIGTLVGRNTPMILVFSAVTLTYTVLLGVF